MALQLDHSQIKNKTTDKEVLIVTENIRTPENVGMIFRISEAFAVKKIIIVGQSPDLLNKKVLRTARSTEKELDILYVEEMQEVISKLKAEDYKLLALEVADTSIDLREYDFSQNNKTALFIGSERFGIESKTLSAMDNCIHINMFGKNSSINVVNALSIALYEFTR